MRSKNFRYPEAQEKGRHLTPTYIGPVRIIGFPTPNTVKIDWGTITTRAHDVHPVSIFKPYYVPMGQRRRAEPQYQIIEGDLYLKIEKIVGHRYNRAKRDREYRVHYEGADDSTNEWISRRQLIDSHRDMVVEYEVENPI